MAVSAALAVAAGSYFAVRTADPVARASAKYSQTAPHTSGLTPAQAKVRLAEVRHQIGATRAALAQLPHLISALTATGTSQTQISHLKQRLQHHLTVLLAAEARLVRDSKATSPTPHPGQGQGGSSQSGGSGTDGSQATSPKMALVIAYARAQLGKPYEWGGTGPDAFDCSGLVQRAYQAAGVTIPRTTQEQQAAGTRVSLSDLEPGDLIFTEDFGHVALYIGNGQVIQARHTGTVIAITDMPDEGVNAYVRISDSN